MPAPSPNRQIAFLTNLQRLLGEGSFVSTYKYCLLMALADLCVERGRDDDAPLGLPILAIAEKFVEYYWRQCVPYTRGGDRRLLLLKQNTGEAPRIIKLLQDRRRVYNGSLADFRRDVTPWRRTMTQVGAQIRKMPLWRLQSIGREQLEFLYDKRGSSKTVTLKPGISFCFRKHHLLVADLVKGAWAQYVRRYNTGVFGQNLDLHEFLFGSERANLTAAKPVLEHYQRGECFYCGKPLRIGVAHVDHFVPWSRYPVDLGHNLVLSHGSCNERKSDKLAAVEHLECWTALCAENGSHIGRDLDRAGLISDLATSLRIADWAYAQTFQCGGLTWVRNDELQPLPPNWDKTLHSLTEETTVESCL